MHSQSTDLAMNNYLVLGISLLFGFSVIIQYEVFHEKPQASFETLKEEFVAKPEVLRAPSSDQVIDQKPGPSGPMPPHHIVFSTSCDDQQNWESYVLFYHAMKVKQPGTVTRIASGCNDAQKAGLEKFHENFIQKMSKDFHIHFTPGYERVALAQGKHPYKYMNKPYGLRDWFEKTFHPEEHPDDIILLLDPDMILLRPLTYDFSDVSNHLFVEKNPRTTYVKRGYPISQQDGYLSSNWMDLNLTKVTQLINPVPYPKRSDGAIHWNTGPPYLATAYDMYEITRRWTEYAPRTLDEHGGLFSEMFGFIHASLQANLPFTMIKSIVISDTGSKREGWPLIEALPPEDVCNPLSTENLPIGLHYCKRYHLGEFFFSKYRLKKNIMNCEQSLLVEPPSNLGTLGLKYGYDAPRADLKDKDTYMQTRRKYDMNDKEAKHNAFMLCAMTTKVNEALVYLKKMNCEHSNLSKNYSIFLDPTNY